MDNIIVTGSAGFIGMHVCNKLLENEYFVIGIDNISDYYDKRLKLARLDLLLEHKNFSFLNLDITNYSKLESAFKKYKPRKVINLAAQAGVRYSLENPQTYVNNNVMGFINILEGCRTYDVEGLIYASSSSVYGANDKTPFSITDQVNKPNSIYAVSKRTNEKMAYTYSKLYNLKTTGLRYFSVYGPWGRPDMAMYLFTEKIINGETIEVFNYGDLKRDFTFIDDIVKGTLSALEKNYQCEIFNLGNNNPEDIFKMIGIIEDSLRKKANISLIKMQLGDVKETFADITYSEKMLNYKPIVGLPEGISKFIEWYKIYNEYELS